MHVLILNIVYFVFVSCALITRTSGRHVFIYLLLYFSDPLLLLNKRINHSIREEKKKKKRQKKKKKNPVTRFLVTPFTRYAVTHFTGGYTHNMLLNMQILKDGAIADDGLYVLIYWQFLLQRRLSDSIEQYNEPPRYRSYKNFAKSIFVVQIYQTDAQHGGSRITNLAERY